MVTLKSILKRSGLHLEKSLSPYRVFACMSENDNRNLHWMKVNNTANSDQIKEGEIRLAREFPSLRSDSQFFVEEPQQS